MGVMADTSVARAPTELERRFEEHRRELLAHCYRMLASPFEAEDAVQETFIRAWRGWDGFEGRSALRSWLYKIATNVCLDCWADAAPRPANGPRPVPASRSRRTSSTMTELTWVEPLPGSWGPTVRSETVRLAFVAALQHLPPRQRAVLILCEVLRWKASEVAELLDTSVASVNSALQRARATLDQADDRRPLDEPDRELLSRYVAAFEAYDIDALTALIHEDAKQSMPPYSLWLTGRDDILTWWYGPGIGCKGSRVLPVQSANGAPAFGQYKPSPDGGYDPWALQVLEIEDGRIVELTFFLDTDRLFPLFDLPTRLES